MTATAEHDLWSAAHAVDRRRRRSRQKKLGASDVGECRRRAGYTYHGVKPSNVSDNKRAAILGTWLHKGLLDALKKEYGARVEITVESPEVKGHVDAYYPPLSMLKELPGRYRAEGVDLPEVGVVEDAKTKSVYAMDRVRELGASRPNLFQVHIYADLLRRGLHKHRYLPAGPLPVDRVRLRYLARDNGDEWVHEQGYDQSITGEAYDWLEEVYAADSPEDLPRDHDGPGLSVICDNCPFLDACWGPPRGDGRARQSILVRDDADVEAALVEYGKQRAVEKDAKARKDKARKMLDAAEPGQYGGLLLGWSGGNPTPAKPDHKAMLALFEKAGLELPMTEPGASPRTIQVKQPKTG